MQAELIRAVFRGDDIPPDHLAVEFRVILAHGSPDWEAVRDVWRSSVRTLDLAVIPSK